jgi:hypothetical protein
MEPIAGDTRVRLCRSCDKPVYDSKSMTRDELYALVVKTEGALPCIQLHLRPDGTIVTNGCLKAVYRTGRWLWLKAAALALTFWSAVAGLSRAVDVATAPEPVSLEIEREHALVLGKLAAVPRTRCWSGPVGCPASLRPEKRPPATAASTEHAAPLRHLAADEDLLPPD